MRLLLKLLQDILHFADIVNDSHKFKNIIFFSWQASLFLIILIEIIPIHILYCC